MNKYQEIRRSIDNGDALTAVKKLIKIAESVDNTTTRDTAGILQSRLKILEGQVAKGIIGRDYESIEMNKILNGILIEVRNLEESEKMELFNENKKNVKVTTQLSEDEILDLAKTAIIIIELEKIKEEFYELDWDKREKILRKLFKFSYHNTVRLAREVFAFLSSVASMTRGGMNSDIAYIVESLVIHYFPYFEKGKEGDDFKDIAFQCIHLADNIFYDAALYLDNLRVGVEGLQILKWIYWRGKESKIEDVMTLVRETYNELESTLKRPERNDLGAAQELLQIFKNDLDNQGLTYPLMPDNIFRLIYGK